MRSTIVSNQILSVVCSYELKSLGAQGVAAQVCQDFNLMDLFVKKKDFRGNSSRCYRACCLRNGDGLSNLNVPEIALA